MLSKEWINKEIVLGKWLVTSEQNRTEQDCFGWKGPTTIQFPDYFMTDQRLKHVFKAVSQIIAQHWQTWGTKPPLFQCFITLSVKKSLLMSNLSLPWHSFKPFSCVLSLNTRKKSSQEEPIFSLQEVAESNETTPLSPSLQTRQIRSLHLALTRHDFQPCHQLFYALL